MSGGMAAGGGHKNYKMTGQVGKAKYGKMMKKAQDEMASSGTTSFNPSIEEVECQQK